MSNIEPRVTALEARMQAISERCDFTMALAAEIRRQLGLLHSDIAELTRLEHRLDEVLHREVLHRLGLVEERFDLLGHRIDHGDARSDRIEHRLVLLDAKIDRHFAWTVGLQMTVMLAIVGALLSTHYW